jgi:hypothetical protein
LKWADEFLYYYTTYGTRQVLNTNPGTVLVGYLLHKLGIDVEFAKSDCVTEDDIVEAARDADIVIGVATFQKSREG